MTRIVFAYLLAGSVVFFSCRDEPSSNAVDNAKMRQIVQAASHGSVRLDKKCTINELGDTLLLAAADIKPIGNESILVSDLRDFRIKEFSRNGVMLRTFGGRGEKLGQFTHGPSKLAVDPVHGRIAAVDFTTPFINVFDKDRNCINRIVAPKPVTDIDYDDQGRLIVAMPTAKEWKTGIVIFDKDNEIVNAFNPEGLYGNPLVDLFSVCFHPRARTIYVMFHYRNLIQEYDFSGHLIQQFSVPGLPDIARIKTKGLFSKELFPEWHIFLDFVISKEGDIYALIGGQESDAGMTLCRINNGVYSIVRLPRKARDIGVDDASNLYCSENSGTQVSKYGEGAEK